MTHRHLTRREMLRTGIAGLIALALRPASLWAQTNDSGSGFTFAVMNDLHYRDERCGEWLAVLLRAISAHQPEFCVLNGDITEHGRTEQLAAVRDAFRRAGVPLRVTIGNHDYLTDDSHGPFDEVFPQRLNYHFEHKGWQFVAIDSTQGQRVYYTRVPETTLRWLDDTLPRLDRRKPSVLFTHFPLGPRVITRPLNAPEVLKCFHGHDLRMVFNGHWHGYARRETRVAEIINGRCCSLWRANNDGSPDKGYFLCRVRGGRISREYRVVEQPAGMRVT